MSQACGWLEWERFTNFKLMQARSRRRAVDWTRFRQGQPSHSPRRQEAWTTRCKRRSAASSDPGTVIPETTAKHEVSETFSLICSKSTSYATIAKSAKGFVSSRLIFSNGGYPQGLVQTSREHPHKRLFHCTPAYDENPVNLRDEVLQHRHMVCWALETIFCLYRDCESRIQGFISAPCG